MWHEQTYLHPRALLGYFPCNSEGNELIVWDPEAPRERELHRLVFPRQPRHDRICLADFYGPLDSGEIDVVGLQAVTAGEEVTELMASLEAEGEFAEQLFVHGLGVQTAEGMAEWVHARVRSELGIGAAQGRRYSWGYPSCPEQSELTKVFALLDAPSIGLRLSGGYAVEPEQSTLAIVTHHPQAGYYGMRNGRLLPNGSPDDVVRGTGRDPSRLDAAALDPWYFPTEDEYRRRLEASAFTVSTITLFPRLTRLPGDVSDWLATFAQPFLGARQVVFGVQPPQNLVLGDQFIEARHDRVEGVCATDSVVEGLLYLFHRLHCGPCPEPTAERHVNLRRRSRTGCSPE